MDKFVKEKRKELLEKEAALKKQEESCALRERQVDDVNARLAQEHAERLDLEAQFAALKEKDEGNLKRIEELQSELAEARNESQRLSREFMRFKDISDTAEKRISLYERETEGLKQSLASQSLFVSELQKQIAELKEINFLAVNDRSRAQLAISEVTNNVSRLLQAINQKSPRLPLPSQSGISMVNESVLNEPGETPQPAAAATATATTAAAAAAAAAKEPYKRELFPAEPTAEEKEMEANAETALDPNFSVHNADVNSELSVDVGLWIVCLKRR